MAEGILEGYKMRKKRYTVIGAGNGGLLTAGFISRKGYEVSLYNRSEDRLKLIKDYGYTIQFGDKSDKIRLNYVGNNLSKAVYHSDVIIVVITANGHSDIAEKLAPYLKDGQIILLVPGRTCGVLLFNHTLNKVGCKANVIVAEANTLFFAARLKSPGLIEIKGIKNEVSVAALYSRDTDYVIDVLSDVFSNIIKANSFLETSFSNIGAIFHPIIFLLNEERILKKEINTLSVVDWLNSRYGLPKTSIYKMIKSNPTYKDILAPTTINHRYVWEDIPTGLVPMSSFGKNLGIPTPTIDYFIEQGSKLLKIDFRSEGRTLRKLGLSSDNLISDLWNIATNKENELQID
jgi:opine dehydrogenase